jgi:uncharacterized coiled-coil protein SlyX
VNTHTHRIIRLEHHVEMQDAELEERAEMITNLEQQLDRPSAWSNYWPLRIN